MSKLRPDPAVTRTDMPAVGTPGEVPQFIPQQMALEAVHICRALELALPCVPLNHELEALFWRIRHLLTCVGFERSDT